MDLIRQVKKADESKGWNTCEARLPSVGWKVVKYGSNEKYEWEWVETYSKDEDKNDW